MYHVDHVGMDLSENQREWDVPSGPARHVRITTKIVRSTAETTATTAATPAAATAAATTTAATTFVRKRKHVSVGMAIATGRP